MNDLQDLLDRMIGTWSGTYRVWLEPGQLHSESSTTATAETVLDGRWVVLRYEWSDQGAPQAGELLLAAPERSRLEASWIDTWHTGGGIMFCRWAGEADASSVITRYGPDDAPWQWRTSFDLPSPDELVVTAWNTPFGEAESMATEARYRRS